MLRNYSFQDVNPRLPAHPPHDIGQWWDLNPRIFPQLHLMYQSYASIPRIQIPNLAHHSHVWFGSCILRVILNCDFSQCKVWVKLPLLRVVGWKWWVGNSTCGYFGFHFASKQMLLTVKNHIEDGGLKVLKAKFYYLFSTNSRLVAQCLCSLSWQGGNKFARVSTLAQFQYYIPAPCKVLGLKSQNLATHVCGNLCCWQIKLRPCVTDLWSGYRTQAVYQVTRCTVNSWIKGKIPLEKKPQVNSRKKTSINISVIALSQFKSDKCFRSRNCLVLRLKSSP